MNENGVAPAITAKAVSADLRGVPDAVSRIEAILSAENAPPEDPAAAPAQAPAPSAEPEAPAQPNKQTEGDEAQPEATAPEHAQLPLEQVEAIELEVTTKGEDGRDVTQKLPVKELKLGYMRQADYQRKTDAVARQREEVAAQSRQASEAATKQLQQELATLHELVMNTVTPEFQGVDMNKLATDDPFEYTKRRNRLDVIQNTLATIQSKHRENEAKQKSDTDVKRKDAITRARETLQADIPGWNDTLYQQIIKSAEKYGFSTDEVSTWVDPRSIKLLYAAEKAATQAPAKVPTDKKIVAVPKVVRPGASQESSQSSSQKQASAMQQLQKSGKLDDAAAVIAARFR